MNSRSLLSVAALVVALLARPCAAAVLWDQSNYDAFGGGFFNSVSGSPPFGLTMYTVSDVTVGATGWHVDKITTYYSRIDPNWGIGITQGYLNVFPKTGPLPVGTDDPTTGTPVTLSSAVFDDRFEIYASVNLDLAPGDYWIGITPIAPSGFFGPEIHMSSLTFLSDASPSYDPYEFPGPPAWFLFSPGLDAAVLLEGTPNPPLAVGPTSWGDMKALYR